MTKPINNIIWRVSQLETNYKELDSKIDLLLTNHLPHLEASVLSLKTRMNVLTLVNIGSIILGIVVSKFF